MRPLETLGLRPNPFVALAFAEGGSTACDAESGRKAAAQQLEGQLQARLVEWRAQYGKVAPVRAWLEGRIAFGEGGQNAELEARKAELDREAEDTARHIAQAEADIAALADPLSDASAYDVIMARRNDAEGGACCQVEPG